MAEKFEVKWQGILPGDPQQVFDGFTLHLAGWLWPAEFEPRVGGAERGITADGGTVTEWDPPRRFQTRAIRSDGLPNQLDYTLEARGEGTSLEYVHSGEFGDDHDEQLDACRQHTEFYLHTFGEYIGHFADRDAAYVEIEASGDFGEVRRCLGLDDETAVGDRVSFQPDDLPAAEATVDYIAPHFVGLCTGDALIRVFGREPWGGGTSVALHLFDPSADAEEAGRAWTGWLADQKAVA